MTLIIKKKMEDKENKKNYQINEVVFNSIDKLTGSSKEISETSVNLMSQLTNLFESIEDETCEEILSDVGKINDFISYVINISKNELQEIKTKSKLAIEKADKRKDKILSLKEEIESLQEEIGNVEEEKQQLILKVDTMSTELVDIYQENQRNETRAELESISKKNEKIIKDKYIQQLDDMQKDMDLLKKKNESYEEGMVKIRRKSIVLEQHNKKLQDELGSKSFQFLMKIQQENELQNKIKSLTEQNEDLYKKIKSYQSQIDNWKEKYKALEAKRSQESQKKKMINIKRFDESAKKKLSRKKDKKVDIRRHNQIEEKNDSDIDYMRYNTYSNLNDLLGSEKELEEDSLKEEKKEEKFKKVNYQNIKTLRKKNDKLTTNKEEINSYREVSFDLDYFFETKINIYENFFF